MSLLEVAVGQLWSVGWQSVTINPVYLCIFLVTICVIGGEV